MWRRCNPAPSCCGIVHRLVTTAELLLARLASVYVLACLEQIGRGTAGTMAGVDTAAAWTTASPAWCAKEVALAATPPPCLHPQWLGLEGAKLRE